MKYKIFIIIFPVLLFLFISIVTLSHYGIIWDEPDHFFRGQAYLNYFLTGSDNYKNVTWPRRSFYQDDSYSTEYFFYKDGGHPPLNDILAAFTNYIFYQKLGILGDLEGLHLFSVLAAALLVLVVSVFAYQIYGLFPALVAAISLASYPLFFSEAHFNVKDPVEAAFFGLTIWAFWRSLASFSWKWLLLSVVAFAMAMGTKFNILFLPFIVVPYLLVRFKRIIPQKLPGNYKLVLIFSPLIVLVLFILFWPYLWRDLGGLLKVFSFYMERGLTSGEEAGIFLPGRINVYPLIWIIITTPVWVLFLTVIGVISAFREKSKNKTALLWVLWLVVPILRVTVPFARTYGGVRQLMEYIPAMALLSGLGVLKLSDFITGRMPWFKKNQRKFLLSVILLLVFVPQISVLVKLHPNENVYFNFLIGGINGAKERNIPYWGNSFGNAYQQGIWWLNKNAETNSSLALLQKVNTNIDPALLRPDIKYQAGEARSGIRREGEYVMELTHQGAMHYYPYMWEYVNKFLEPVYDVSVDGVAIAKVWKNDWQHTKPAWQLLEKEVSAQIEFNSLKLLININISREVLLSRISIINDSNINCPPVMGRVQTSEDGQSFHEELEYLHSLQLPDKQGSFNNTTTTNFYFAGRKAKNIKLLIEKDNPCLFKNSRILVYALQ